MLETLQSLLSGVGNFSLYFLISLIALVVFKFLYTFMTPYDEWALVKEQNTAAACALGGAIIGFTLAIASAAKHSISLLDFGLWALIALVAQLIAFGIVRLFLPRISERITNNEIASGILLGAVSISIGILNAACMSY